MIKMALDCRWTILDQVSFPWYYTLHYINHISSHKIHSVVLLNHHAWPANAHSLPHLLPFLLLHHTSVDSIIYRIASKFPIDQTDICEYLYMVSNEQFSLIDFWCKNEMDGSCFCLAPLIMNKIQKQHMIQ